METNCTDLRQLIQDRKLRVTEMRLKVLELIQNYNSALPYHELQKALPDADRITLYRTLNTLIDKGIIHKAFQSNNETYFALCDHQCNGEQHHHQHIHFKCKKCDVVTCETIDVPLNIDLPSFQVDEVAINVSGICKACL